MDSINKNQPEENHADLTTTDAAKKIKELVAKAGSCFFCTGDGMNGSQGVRPMSVQQTGEDGSLWFLSASDSHKNREIHRNKRVRLYFQGSAHSDFLYLNGEAAITTDRKKIKELWQPILKTWFTEGMDDPRITVIRFVPDDGYYWDTKHGQAIAGIKMMIGALTGRTLDDSIEGEIRP